MQKVSGEDFIATWAHLKSPSLVVTKLGFSWRDHGKSDYNR